MDNVYVDTKVLESNKKFVNGPVNVARLEGEVNGIKKVIYLFMDMHQDITQQFECSNVYAQHINTYLMNNFVKLKDSKKTIDVFLEEEFRFVLRKDVVSGWTRHNIKGTQKTDKYITEVLHMFKKMFNFSNETNKVFKIPSLDNIRIHYVDPRNMFAGPTGIRMEGFQLYTDLLRNVYDITGNQASQTKQYIINLKKQWEYFQQIINECLNKANACKDVKSNVFGGVNAPENYESYIRHMFHKMMHRYNHKHIQKVLVSYLTTEIEKITQIITKLGELYVLFEKLNYIFVDSYYRLKDPDYSIKNKYVYNPYFFDDIQKFEQFEKPLIELDSEIIALITYGFMYMDVFFLRRFLDKDYITNVVAYTGTGHSANFIEILVQSFDFKITNMAITNDLDIFDITKQIKEAKHREEIMYMLYPKILNQCSDLTTFPENFE